jgi:arylsulfatase A-like enzyme
MKSIIVSPILLFLALASCLQGAKEKASSPTSKPNVIVIMADDLGYHDLGFQGSDTIETPHIDTLAASGVVFTDAHVSASVCGPSRAGFITGRYQTRFGYEANPLQHDRTKPTGLGVDLAERTMGEAFKSLGYTTSIIGKWHLGDTEAHYPNNRGFDHFWGIRGGSRHYWYNPEECDVPGSPRAIEHNGTQIKIDGFLTDLMADQAIEFVETNKDKPFFIFLSFTAPHTPLQAKQEDLDKYDGNAYAALVDNMDQNVGRLLKTLEHHKLRENTMIWFLSDNGGVVEAASNQPLKGTKGMKFDGGHRVPFVLNWPAKLKPGTYDKLTSALDIFATSYAAAGGEPFTDRPLDGVNLLPHVSGDRSDAPHDQLYWRRLGVAAIRDGDWKLIRATKMGGGHALYNIAEDIAEQNNLAKKMPEKAKELLDKLSAWEEPMLQPLWGETKGWETWQDVTHLNLFENKPIPTKEEAMEQFKRWQKNLKEHQ